MYMRENIVAKDALVTRKQDAVVSTCFPKQDANVVWYQAERFSGKWYLNPGPA
jgi:hypothetical protein